MKSDLYDALTLELDKAERLMEFLAEQLHDLSACSPIRKLYPLALIAEHIRELHQHIGDRAAALHCAVHEAIRQGAR